MPQKSSKELTGKFYQFIENHSPVQVSRHLRGILLDYIGHQLNTGLPPDFNIYIWELYDLFELLDYAADEKERLNKEDG